MDFGTVVISDSNCMRGRGSNNQGRIGSIMEFSIVQMIANVHKIKATRSLPQSGKFALEFAKWLWL